MLAPLWGQACERDRHSSKSLLMTPCATAGSSRSASAVRRRFASTPASPPRTTRCNPPYLSSLRPSGGPMTRHAFPRAATIYDRVARHSKPPFPPPREKIALEFPTFRFFKTWDLRASSVKNRCANRPRVPHRFRACFPRLSRFAPPVSCSPTRFRPSKTARNPKPTLLAMPLQQARNKPVSVEGDVRQH